MLLMNSLLRASGGALENFPWRSLEVNTSSPIQPGPVQIKINDSRYTSTYAYTC